MHGGKAAEPESTLGYLWGRVFGSKPASSSAKEQAPPSVQRAPSAPLAPAPSAPLPPLHDRSPLRKLRTVEPGKQAPPKAQARDATRNPMRRPPPLARP
jgi:hypothetical protein